MGAQTVARKPAESRASHFQALLTKTEAIGTEFLTQLSLEMKHGPQYDPESKIQSKQLLSRGYAGPMKFKSERMA